MASRNSSNQKNVANSIITMDSRKFLGAINNGLQSKVAVMEQRVKDLGAQAGVNWRLANLGNDSLFIEDVDNNIYYGASYHREKGGNVVINNVKPIRIVESKKKTLFEASCKQLVDAIETNDQRAMNVAFGKMASQRFSSRTVPFSGLVRTHDNITRHINLASESIIDEDIRPKLISAIVEGLTDKVVIREGIPVSGTFVNNKLRIPISEWLCRKAVARHMRQAANDAYLSPGFQNRVYDVAKLVYEDKIEQAVSVVSAFLTENQEFTLLNRSQTKCLIENALATRACFNQQLCNDTATLFWRTNLKVNKDIIISEWRTTARKASHPTLLENVNILEQSQNFEAAYDKFVNLIFNEAVGPRDVQVHAYKTALEALKGTSKIKESNELSGKIDELIERLEQPESDHAIIAEVEDLLAEVSNEMNALENLDKFDKMPGGDEGGIDDNLNSLGDVDGDEGLGGSEAPTTVNFNINIGTKGEVSTSGLGGEEEEGGDDELNELLGKPEEEEGGGELDDLLGDEEEEEELGGGGDEELAALLKGESRNKRREPISEEDDDPYSYNKSKKISGFGSDYGTKPIEIAEDCHKAIEAMMRIAEHNDLNGMALIERAHELAHAGMKRSGIIVPERRMNLAVEQLCDAFFDELDRQGVELDEDQYKGPWRHIWGRKKAAINQRERKKGTKSESRERTVSENRFGECDERTGTGGRLGGESQTAGGRPPRPGSTRRTTPSTGLPPARRRKGPPRVEWVEEQTDAKKGYFGGVGFIFDHANGNDEPVILSEDGKVEVPIPSGLYESAFAAAEMGNGDPKPFISWLIENIEQLRPISEEENNNLDNTIREATVKIKTTIDGGIDVEVDSADPDVNITDPIEPGMEDDIGSGMEPDIAGDIAPGMEPVDAIPPMPGMESGVEGDVGMPDFESDEEMTDAGEGIEPDIGDEEPDMGDEMPDFGGDEEETEEESEPVSKKKPPKSPKKEKKKKPAEEDEEDEGVVEDRDITTPQNTRYNTAKQDHRKKVDVPKVKGKSGGKLDGFDTGDVKTSGVDMKKVTPRGNKK